MKSTLLFFDGVALSLPQDIADRMIESSPALAQPLAEQGLLINLEPDSHLQPDTAARLATGLYETLERLDPDALPLTQFRGEASAAATTTIGYFHWGGVRARLESSALSDLMITRGLAERHDETMASVRSRRTPRPDPTGHELLRLNPAVRLLVLNAYCQALRTDLQRQSNIALQPVTDAPRHTQDEWYRSMQDLRRVASSVTPGAGFAAAEIAATDLHTLDVDVSAVPLNEILSFRAEHRTELLAYVEGMRTLLETLSGLSELQYESEKQARIERLTEEAVALKSATRKAFGRASMATGLAVAGAVWTGTQGDLVGALLAGAAATAAIARPAPTVTAYTYVLAATRL